jgi:dTDP-4-amino-4,6-dideoxygalactose transaminase
MVSEQRPRYLATRPELPPMEAWQPILAEAYDSNWFTNYGALSRRFEDKLAQRWGFAETACVAASSGTVALTAPLIMHDVKGPVLTPAFTFPATASAIKMAGAEPVLVDVDAKTWRVTPQALDAALAHTGAGAAIVVCPFGLKSDWSAHIEVARARSAILIIDNAAGLGVARANVERSPSVFEIYSLHATKPFGIGEGGVIFAHRDSADLLRSAMNFGLPWRPGKPNTAWGVNGKLSELHAAVGLAVEQSFDQRLSRRRRFAAGYMERLAALPDIQFPTAPDESCWQVFPVLMPNEGAAERVVEDAHARGMEVRRYYRPSLSMLPGFDGAQCPASEDLARRMICLPVYSQGADDEQNAVLEIADAVIGGA